MRDDWKLEGYDPDDIWRKSSDERGHSAQYRIKVPEDWAGQLQEFVESSHFPEYRSVADFFRDAVYHRLRYWQGRGDRPITPELKQLMARARMASDLASIQARSRSEEELIRDLDETATLFGRDNNWRGLWEYLNNAEDIAREGYDGPYLERVLERITYWRKRADRF